MAGKRKSTWRRRILRVAVVLLLLFAVAALLLYRAFLTPDALKARAVRFAAERTGCHLRIESAKFEWSKGILFNGVRLQEPDDAAESPVLSLARARIIPRWGPLLRGSFQPSSVEINDLSVVARLDKEGRWPFLGRFKVEGAGGEAESRISLTNANVRIAPTSADGPVPPLEIRGISAEIVPSPGAGPLALLSIGFTDAVLGNWTMNGTVVPSARSAELIVAFSAVPVGPELRPFVPPAWQARWDEIGPGVLSGYCVLVLQSASSPLVQVKGNVILKEGVVSPPQLPLPLTGIFAEARFDNSSLEVTSFSAWFGDAELSGKGSLALDEKRSLSYNAELDARNLPLEAALVQKLPERVRDAWIRLDPAGSLDAHLKLNSRPQGAPEYEATVKLSDVSLAPKELIWPVKALRGAATIKDGALSVTDPLHAEWAGGKLEIIGAGDLKKETLTIGIKFTGVGMDRKLADLLPVDFAAKLPGEIYEKWAREGSIKFTTDGLASLSLDPGKPPRWQVAARIPDLRFSNPRLSEPVVIRADAVLTPEAITLASAGVSWAGATGTLEPVTIPFDPALPWKVAFRIRDVNLTPELRDHLPPRVQHTWNEFHNPTGIMDLEGTVWRNGGEDAKVHSHILNSIRNATAAFSGFPFPLRDLHGQWDVVDDYLTNLHVVARTGETDIDITVQKAPYKDMPGRRYVIRGRNAPFNQELYNALPPEFQGLYKPEKMTGRFDLDLMIHYVRPQGDTPGWSHFEALATIPELHLATDPPFSVTDARVAIEDASVVKGHVNLSGKGRARELVIERVPLGELFVGFRSEKDNIAIEPILAACYGGKLSGALRLDARENDNPNRFFGGSFRLSEANVKKISSDRDVKNLSGDLTASSIFFGTTGEPDTFRAFGAMVVLNGEIGALPDFLAPLNLLVLNKLGAGAFDTMELAYRVEGDSFIAREINFYGRLISLKGSGTIGKEGTLDFTFVHELGPRLPAIPGIDEIVTFLKRQFIPINVKGAYNDPVLHINPILSLTQVVQRTFLTLIPINRTVEKEKPTDG